MVESGITRNCLGLVLNGRSVLWREFSLQAVVCDWRARVVLRSGCVVEGIVDDFVVCVNRRTMRQRYVILLRRRLLVKFRTVFLAC